MTYQELYEQLGRMCEKKRRNSDVTVVCTDSREVFAVDHFITNWKEDDYEDEPSGVLDEGHPFLTIPY